MFSSPSSLSLCDSVLTLVGHYLQKHKKTTAFPDPEDDTPLTSEKISKMKSAQVNKELKKLHLVLVYKGQDKLIFSEGYW